MAATPKMSADLFGNIWEAYGEETAGMAFDNIESGLWTEEDVKSFMGRPDIDPEDWQDFEDGWRPNKW